MTEESSEGSGEVDAGSGEHLFAPELRRFPWLRAAGTGVGAFLTEYLTLAAIVGLHPNVSTGADTTIEWVKSIGIIQFNAHMVPVVRRAQEITYQGPNRFNLILDASNPAVPAVVYLAIPILALLAAGAAFEWWRPDGGEERLEGGALVGVGLMVGYLAVGFLATFAVATTTTFEVGSVTEGVDRLLALVALVGYPMVAATAGALTVRLYADA